MNPTQLLLTQLKQEGQDAEWYPTTEKMVSAVMRCLPEDANSIMDIGAGDGRVLKMFAEKCKHAILYAIEISSILIQAQSANVVPVGTDFFQQNLGSLATEYIFCNPPYSQYDEWMCRIIEQGYSKKAFLVIPQRWKEDNSIQDALKRRGASARVIYSDDFLDGERPARAIIDIVEITFPTDKWGDKVEDPFNIWFDQNIDTFEKAAELNEREASQELARKLSNATIDEMVEAYNAEYLLLESNYRAIFKLDYAILQELGINKDAVRDGLKKKLSGLKVKYWQVLFDRLDAITSRLSTRSKKTLLDKLTANTSVDFTTQNIYAVVLWVIKNANQYFDEQLIELFYELTTFEGVLNYKSNVRAWDKYEWRYGRSERTNTHYALDYRIVVSRWNAINKERYDSWNYPGNLSTSCHELIADVVAVLSNLGFKTSSSGSLNRQWEGGQWQNFYKTGGREILFQVKAYLNGNLHFRFMPDAIKALNVNVGRLLKWLRTEEDVVTELGYTAQEAKEYFRCNAYLPVNSVKLLGSGK